MGKRRAQRGPSSPRTPRLGLWATPRWVSTVGHALATAAAPAGGSVPKRQSKHGRCLQAGPRGTQCEIRTAFTAYPLRPEAGLLHASIGGLAADACARNQPALFEKETVDWALGRRMMCSPRDGRPRPGVEPVERRTCAHGARHRASFDLLLGRAWLKHWKQLVALDVRQLDLSEASQRKIWASCLLTPHTSPSPPALARAAPRALLLGHEQREQERGGRRRFLIAMARPAMQFRARNYLRAAIELGTPGRGLAEAWARARHVDPPRRPCLHVDPPRRSICGPARGRCA